jgi:hypothetical protein
MQIGYGVFSSDGRQDYLGVVDKSYMKYDQIRSLTSDNLGNLMFKYAARTLFENEVTYISYNDDPNELRKKIDILVLPEANLINPKIDYGRQANFVKTIDKPVVLLGVGAQSGIDGEVKKFPQIPQGTIDFLEEVSLRTPQIFCRGDFTRKLINGFGISNVKSVGCPTFLMNPSRFLWKKIVSRDKDLTLKRLAITEGIYQKSTRNDAIDFTEKYLFNTLINNHSYTYIGQEQTSVIKAGYGSFNEINGNDVKFLKNYLAPETAFEVFHKVLLEQSRAFYRVDQWIGHAKSRTGLIGTRIHGNMMGIQSGIPSIPIIHDSRTKELCETMRIPHININEFSSIVSEGGLINAFDILFNAPYKELDELRCFIASEYSSLINEVGMTPSEKLLHLSGLNL